MYIWALIIRIKQNQFRLESKKNVPLQYVFCGVCGKNVCGDCCVYLLLLFKAFWKLMISI